MDHTTGINELEFCSLDLETTGVNPAFDRIVEIGAVRFTTAGVINEYQKLVNPGVSIPPNVIKIHGITDSMVEGAPLINDILDEFYEFFKGAILVIQNPRFDLSFIERAFHVRDGKSPELKAIDTVNLAQKHFPALPNHKISTLANHLGLNLQSHRALDDAIACMSIFTEVIKGRGLITYGELMRMHGDMVRPGLRYSQGSTREPWRRLVIGKDVKIRYKDTDGRVTSRIIHPREFIQYGKSSYILAWCYLRESERCFMASRIVSINRLPPAGKPEL